MDATKRAIEAINAGEVRQILERRFSDLVVDAIMNRLNLHDELVDLIGDSRLNPPCDGASPEDTYHWFADFELWRIEARALFAKAKGE